MWEQPLCAAEEALLSKAVEKRRREFRAGRHCAHTLFQQQGIHCNALLKGKQREPVWPSGWVGSISHTQGLCVAAIASDEHYLGIGLDVEAATPLSQDVLNLVCDPYEQAQICQLTQKIGNDYASASLDKLIFSAKECIHKVYFPMNYHTLGFLDAHVVLDMETQQFSATILNPEAESSHPITTLQGVYQITDHHIMTFIGLKRFPKTRTGTFL